MPVPVSVSVWCVLLNKFGANGTFFCDERGGDEPSKFCGERGGDEPSKFSDERSESNRSSEGVATPGSTDCSEIFCGVRGARIDVRKFERGSNDSAETSPT